MSYYTDPRNAPPHQWWEVLDDGPMTATVWIPLPLPANPLMEYEEELITVPFTWAVCDRCEGKGTHVNPSIDCDGLTREDFDDDPDFADSYRAGEYDVPCAACQGRRVMPQTDDPRVLAKQGELAAYARESARELAMEY